MARVLDVRPRSLADFLAWEEQQDERYERVDGDVRPRTGDTRDHNRITLNVALMLECQIREQGCEAFTSTIKVISPGGDVMYPDVIVVCDTLPDQATWIETPIVVVEVLSDSTAEHDDGRKRWAYQKIPSLKHYLLVDQNEPVVEVASRADDGSWRSVLHRGLDARLRLDALGVELGLDEIFARVTFAPASAARAAEPSAGSR